MKKKEYEKFILGKSFKDMTIKELENHIIDQNEILSLNYRIQDQYIEERDNYKQRIDKLEKYINTLVEINGKYGKENTESLYSKKWLKEIMDDLLKIIKGE